ncbi:hypothetical protein SELMODRAFT_106240 [Selaginella moellendorffii]|uniref:Cytochrome P450-dependent monooxygenase n=1 Tax=Selaginella moellendorffii TaxID=88036 RepID=D8S1E6_SELML|nr:hypothetical protein SELMODRAFT_106240 [Selaginella moellendorffii]
MATIFAGVLVFLVLFVLTKRLSFTRQRLPPSPLSLPLIGHLHLLARMAHQSLQVLSNKYGPILYLKLGMVPTIVVSSPDMAREILKTHDAKFSSRPYFLVGEYFSYGYCGMGFTPGGEHWKNLRKLCATELFTINRIDSFEWVRKEEISRMISTIENTNGVINIRNLLITYGFNVMTETVMSKRFFCENGALLDADQAREFKKVSIETVEMALKFHISEFVPSYLRWIDWNIPKVKILQAKSDKFMQQIVQEHKRSKNSRKTKDFMDVMLESFTDSSNKQSFKAENTVKALTMELLAGGTDTSASSIEWALMELLLNPHTMVKAREELVKFVDLTNSTVNEGDLPKLTYLNAVIKETMRLHPPAPLLVPHKSTVECKIAGFDIPKGTTTIVNLYAIGRDPNVWENPTKFCPERFLGDSRIDVKGQNFELIPFGSGRRTCPGMILGLRNVQLVLANLIHRFEWALIPGREYGVEETTGTVNWAKTPLEVLKR